MLFELKTSSIISVLCTLSGGVLIFSGRLRHTQQLPERLAVYIMEPAQADDIAWRTQGFYAYCYKRRSCDVRFLLFKGACACSRWLEINIHC